MERQSEWLGKLHPTPTRELNEKKEMKSRQLAIMERLPSHNLWHMTLEKIVERSMMEHYIIGFQGPRYSLCDILYTLNTKACTKL